MSRVHNFSDNKVQLFDATKAKNVALEFEWDHDSIFINRKRVQFNPAPNFSSKAFTQYVLVKDDENKGAGWYEIIQQELPRPSLPTPMAIRWSFKV